MPTPPRLPWYLFTSALYCVKKARSEWERFSPTTSGNAVPTSQRSARTRRMRSLRYTKSARLLRSTA